MFFQRVLVSEIFFCGNKGSFNMQVLGLCYALSWPIEVLLWNTLADEKLIGSDVFKDVYRANNYCRRNGTAFNIDSEKHICCKPSMYMKQVRKVKNSQRHQGVAACRWFTRLLLLQVPFCQCLWNDSVLLDVFATFKIVGSGSTHELYVKVASELFGLLKVSDVASLLFYSFAPSGHYLIEPHCCH